MSGVGPKLNLLVAYPYITKDIVAIAQELGDSLRWLVDSGAFTAWKSGAEITLDQYCRFLETLPVKPWRYFTLDVIGDPAATMRNYEAMLSRGFNPIPIFTRGDDLIVLDAYYKTSDVVGLGGIADRTTGSRELNVHRIMKRCEGRKVHLLGYTVVEYLKKFRPYSVDSSSWEGAARFGGADIYLGFGRFKRLHRMDARTRPDPLLLDKMRKLGIDAYDLRLDENWHGLASRSRYVSAMSWVAASMDVERNLGTLLFLAVSNDHGARLLRDVFYKQTELACA